MNALARSLARHLPATDRSGRLSFVKALAWLGAMTPGLLLVGTGMSEGYGPKPVTFVTHALGDAAVWLLIATLAVSPVRTITRWNALIHARRILGNFALGYAFAHFAVFVWSEGVVKAATEIMLRFYLTIGFAALAMLVALGVTSNDAAVKRLGAEGWKRVHRWIYSATALGLLHYFLQSKNDVTPALLQAGFFVLLMLWRGLDRFKRGAATPWLVGLALTAGLATASLEVAWYFWRSGLPALAVLGGNLDFDLEIRPPWIVAGAGLAGAALSLFRRRTGTARRH